MTRPRFVTAFVSVFLALGLLGVGPVRGEKRAPASARTMIEPFADQTLAGEVMWVDKEKRILVVRVIEDREKVRDIAIALDDRTVLKKLQTPISGGDLTPGHLVKVTYRDHAGGLLAHRIEVTGKAVRQSMP